MSYICSNGHEIGAPDDVKLKRCPLVFCGSTELTRVGEGAVKAKACDGSGKPAEPIRRNSKKGHCDVCDKNVTLTKDGNLWTHDGPHSDEPTEVEPEPEPIETVTVAISGSAYQIVSDGNWRNDCPRGWAEFQKGKTRLRGKGSQFVFTMLRDDAIDLSDYLDSVAGVVGDMSAAERSGGRESVVADKAREAIDKALLS